MRNAAAIRALLILADREERAGFIRIARELRQRAAALLTEEA